MRLPECVRENVSLAPMTTFGIGGPARWLAEPADRRALAEALSFARGAGARIKIMGGGSNVLVSDAGIDAMVVRLSPKGEFGVMEQDPDDPLAWTVGAAVGLQALVGATAREGIEGLEFLAGIPGSAGGAVAMNCGSAENGIGRFVLQAEVCRPDGTFAEMGPAELAFSYRRSGLGGSIAVRVLLRFDKVGDPEKVLDRMREYRERKRAGQPLAIPSSGCIFKNPPGDSAGGLIDRAGCKGMREGGAEVSSLHANFIVNQDNASCRDVVTLACRVRERVEREFGIVLEPEVALWGEAKDFGCFGGHGHVDK